MAPQAPPSYTASPLGNFPEMAQAYATSFTTPASNAQTNVQYQQDQTTLANQAKAAEAAKQAEADAKARAAAFSEAKNYTVQQRSDGGYGFYGPDGKEVTAAQYANNTGQKLTDVLKSSQNPIDQRYIQDQNDLTAYLKAKAQSSFDKQSAATASKYEQLVQKQYGVNLAKQNPSQLINLFQSNYPTIYGANQNNAPGPTGPNLLLPTSGQVGREVKSQYPTGFGNFSSGGAGGGFHT